MKKNSLFAMLILVSLLLASCDTATPAPTATLEPTSPPATDVPVVEPTQESAPQPSVPDPAALSANPWQWVSFTNPVEQFNIDMPEVYLLNFAEDGTLQIVADCNNASGSYRIDGSSLTIEIGPMTMAACSEDSHSDQFVQLLSGSAIYFYEDGNLYIDLMADGGTLEFAPADEELPVDDGEGAMDGALWANPWQWVSFTSPVEQFEVETPESYLLNFAEDGRLQIVADCNNASAEYSVDGTNLTIAIGPMTLAACPPDSRSDQFIHLLSSAAIFFFQDGDLYIDLMADSGTLRFAPADLESVADSLPSDLAGILGNLSYNGIFPDQEITLMDGYAYYDEGDGGSPYVQLVERQIVTDDLDGDGTEDAVALLVDYSTGSGDFVYLIAVLDVWSDPAPVDALMIGDLGPVKSLSTEDSQVVVELISLGPGDPDCCPTWNMRKTFGLADEELVESSSETLNQVLLNDLWGTSWQLIDLNMGQEPVLPETEITLMIEDGQISGSAGCNTYNSSVSGDEDMPTAFSVGPIATTRMVCDEALMNQETTYLERLAEANSWRYDFGYLALTYMVDGDVFGDLLFAPTSGKMMADDGGEALWASDWQWVSYTNPVEQFEIDMPENYQLIFFDDGTFQIVADCNNAGGAFVDEDGALSIEMFQSTLAVCPGDSRSEQFIELLGGAARYFFEDGNLYIDLMADGGTLAFAPVPVPDLVNTPWQWISFTGNSGHFEVDSPESYVLTLLDDGSLSIVADCNTVLSDYTTDGESLTINPGAATLALCPDDSRSEQFVQLLVSAKRYFIVRNNLFVVVEEDGGTMVFDLADEMALDAPSLTANPWQWSSFTNPMEQFEVEQPDSYQLTFNADGTLDVVADCNIALGSYSDDAGALTIEFGPMTLVVCPTESRSDQFVQYLMGAARYFFEDGSLYIDLMADSGTMAFEAAHPE